MKYTKPEHIQFVKDMKASDRHIEHYSGNYGPTGPCTTCQKWDLQDICRETNIRLQWHNMTWNYTVYPSLKE